MLKQRYAITCCLILLVGSLLCGCEGVTIEEPVGEPWTLMEMKAIEGNWIGREGDPMKLVVVSEEDIRMGAMSWDSERKRFVARTDRFHLRHVGKMDFSFYQFPNQTHPRFVLARIQMRTDGSLMCQGPEVKLVIEAIRTGKLTGVLEKQEKSNNVHPHLKCSGDELAKWIEETGEDVVFPKVEDESELIFTKAKKPERKAPDKK